MTITFITRDDINDAAQNYGSARKWSAQVRQDNGSYKDTLDIIAVGNGYAIAQSHVGKAIARITTKHAFNDIYVGGWKTQWGWAVAARVVFAEDTGDAAGTLSFDDEGEHAYAARINIGMAEQMAPTQFTA